MTKILMQGLVEMFLTLVAMKILATASVSREKGVSERVSITLIEWSKALSFLWMAIQVLNIVRTWAQVILFYDEIGAGIERGVAVIILWIWSISIAIMSPALVGLRRVKWLFASICILVISSSVILLAM